MNFQLGVNDLKPVARPDQPAVSADAAQTALQNIPPPKSQIDLFVAGVRSHTGTALMTTGGVLATGFVNGSGIVAAGVFAAMTGNVAAAGVVATAFALNYVTKIVSKPIAIVGAAISGERVKDVFAKLWP